MIGVDLAQRPNQFEEESDDRLSEVVDKSMSEDFFSTLIGLLRRTKNVEQISTDESDVVEIEGGPEEFKGPFVDLVNSAKRSIDQGSSLHTPFYSDEKVQTAITEAAERVERFRILIDPGVDVEEKQVELEWLFDLPINFRQARSEIAHTMVIDRKHLRWEERHSPSTAPTKNAIIYHPNTMVVYNEINEFSENWSSATPLDV